MSGPAKPRLLVALNAGSSSVKLALFRAENGQARAFAQGLVDLQRQPLALVLRGTGAPGEGLPEDPIEWPITVPIGLHQVVGSLLAALETHAGLGELAAAGHRVVHGGSEFHGAVRIDAATLTAMDALTPLAPLHQQHSLRLIRALRQLRPGLAQCASFDTAFHAGQDPLARRFALPRELHDQGIRRYGFHGLSYAFIARRLAERHPVLGAGRVVAAHLGSGASLCAMNNGRSVDTSMGFSTLDGVPMGTRCGALDAGVVLHLLQRRGMSVNEVEDLLYHHSGLLGVSGSSADVRSLEASAEPAAREALDLFALRVAGEAARLATTLGGLDALVFTGGIGEHDARLRAAVVARLAWLGAEIDPGANARHAELLHSAASRVALLVLATDEEQVIADETLALLG